MCESDTVIVEEVSSLKNNGFGISVWGQLQWVNFPDAFGKPIYCRSEIVLGSDWSVIGGLTSGLSQTTISRSSHYNINLPIEILLHSTNPFGWPQIIISCYTNDECIGIGRIHLPLQPRGSQNIEIKLARPLPSTVIGKYPEFQDPNILAKHPQETYYQLRMRSCGTAQLNLNITMNDIENLGYDLKF